MTLVASGLWLTLLWVVIYAVKYAFGRPNRRLATQLTVKHLHIRLKTEAFNVVHKELSFRLSPSRSRIWRQILLRLYDVGSVVGVVGTLLGFCLLLLTAASLSLELVHVGHSASTITKRGLDHIGDAAPALRISPVIPGLTVPLSHLPLVLVALVMSQIVHEVGHAITAALHRIPMLSCGVAVTFLLPSAFVTLPLARLEKLPPRDRLQIASSGCFHNFVFLCLLLSAASSGFTPTRILFQDISAQGRLVIGVDYDSPLATHLPVGTLITKIDDSTMASVSSDDPWDHYLLSPFSDSIQGWCADKSFISKASAPACTTIDSYSCFVSKADETEQYELDPVHIFTDNPARCNSSTECSSVTTCVVPRHDQQLVRISVLRDYRVSSIEDTIVWKGPKEEIWEQVRVSTVRSRFSILPYTLPKLASAFFEYMKIANLSLYLVNMLPITALDGYQSLVALSQLFCGRLDHSLEDPDIEALTDATQPRREAGAQRACRTSLSSLALLLVALCGFLGTITWAKRPA